MEVILYALLITVFYHTLNYRKNLKRLAIKYKDPYNKDGHNVMGLGDEYKNELKKLQIRFFTFEAILLFLLVDYILLLFSDVNFYKGFLVHTIFTEVLEWFRYYI